MPYEVDILLTAHDAKLVEKFRLDIRLCKGYDVPQPFYICWVMDGAEGGGQTRT